MKNIFYSAQQRGHANFGWLNSHLSFSFGHWYDPAKIHFGALRVLNDDVVKGGAGFGTHPHDNMEIISLPLKGALTHKDSTGTVAKIITGDVQIMSAGTGIQHSEYNASPTEDVNFLQIWIIPKIQNIKPRYDQRTYPIEGRKNQWQIVVSPSQQESGVWINQDAQLALTHLEVDKEIEFTPRYKGNGVFLFLLEGQVQVGDQTLDRRDALGVSQLDQLTIKAIKESQLLAIEVPMLTEGEAA